MYEYERTKAEEEEARRVRVTSISSGQEGREAPGLNSRFLTGNKKAKKYVKSINGHYERYVYEGLPKVTVHLSVILRILSEL